MAEQEGRLPDYAEKAFAEGRPWIIQGQVYTRREDVPAKWFKVPGLTAADDSRALNAARLKEAGEIRARYLSSLPKEAVAALAMAHGLSAAGVKAALIERILTAEGLAGGAVPAETEVTSGG